MDALLRHALAGVAIAALAACNATPPDDSARWVRVVRDANYTIYIDTGRIGPFGGAGAWGKAYEIWYRTDHATPRVHEPDKRVFDREIVQSVIQCDSLFFRVASVDMSMGSARPIVQQRLTHDELQHQRWRRVELGAAEEIAARAACHFAKAATRR